MANPYKARTPRSCGKSLQNPEANSKTMNALRQATMTYLRPYLQSLVGMGKATTRVNGTYRSAMLPEKRAPTERSISVMVIPHVTAAGSLPKSLAISVAVRETVKKSNASQAHEKKPMPNKFHW